MTRREKVIYLAGLIDGEGCIGAYNIRSKGDRRAANYVVNLRVTMKSPAPIKMLHDVFGGNLKVYASKGKGKPGPYFAWQIRATKCIEVLKELKEFLTEKKSQAEVAIEYHDICQEQRSSWERCKRYPQEFLDVRDVYITKLKDMKRVKYLGNELN